MRTETRDTALLTGAHLISGPAGSGKTSLLVERYIAASSAGERGLLFLVPSRRAARALSERILRVVGASTDLVRVSTWHAFALSLLRQHYRALGYEREPALLTGPEQFNLVREMLDAPEEQRHWASLRAPTRLMGFAEEMREFVLRAQDELASPEQLHEQATAARRPDLQEAALFFRRYLDILDQQNLVDHANVIALAVRLAQQDSEVAREIHEGTRHLFVDEFQDLTPSQESLLRALFVPGGSVHVAADPESRIFAFRGASGAVIDAFRRDFPPVSEVVCSASHRSASEVVAWRFEHLNEEADAIAAEARRVHAREGVPWAQISVIVRRHGPTSRAVRAGLERAGVPYVVVGENRPLPDEPALEPMLELARLALLRDDLDDGRLQRLLSSAVGGLDPYEVRALRREARVRRTDLAGLVAEPPEDLPARLRDALVLTRDLVSGLRALEATEPRPDDVFWFLWERLGYFRDIVASGDDNALDAIAAFARAIERFSDRRPGQLFTDYLRMLDAVEFGSEAWQVPEQRRPDAVRLRTAHQAQGTEAEVVFVAGAVEGEFPDLRDRRALLDIRDLLEPSTLLERRRRRLDAERRLFGVAITRARRRLVLTGARASSQLRQQATTPFVELVADGWSAPAPSAEPLTPAEAEASWRRIARDASRPDAERLEAVAMLARLPGVDTSRWWFERDWTVCDTPLHEGEFKTSYSRLSPYENCGLQYLYQVELGLDPEQTFQMQVGSWVHDIVDRCARSEIPADEASLLAELERVWNPAVFPDRAREHRAKISCAEMLRRWLDADAKRTVLATEVEFAFPLAGALLRGFIDRISPCGTKSAWITDYKTGTSDKNEQEVKEDLQLATYYLAMRRDPDLARFGEPMRMELAYLARAWGGDGFKRPAFDPRRIEGYEESAVTRLTELIEGVRAERFAPSADANCRWCKFKTLCPVWDEGDEVRL